MPVVQPKSIRLELIVVTIRPKIFAGAITSPVLADTSSENSNISCGINSSDLVIISSRRNKSTVRISIGTELSQWRICKCINWESELSFLYTRYNDSSQAQCLESKLDPAEFLRRV